MNTMPKDTTPTPSQMKLISERAERKQEMKDLAAEQTENLMGRIPSRTDLVEKMRSASATPKRVATGMKAMMTQLGRVEKQEGIDKARQEAKLDAANDSMLSKLAKKQLSITPKGSSRRKRKSRGGRKKRSTRRKV